jgi:protoporphyrinogen oxidase
VLDVIIVGGGAAGTFVGYRLLTAVSPPPRVLLLEASARIGGRLYSEKLPKIDFNVAELGGMRFINNTQPYFTRIVQEFGIETKEFLMDEENEDRPFLFRDYFVQQKDLEEAGKAYQLKPEEQGKTPREVSEWV